MRAKKIQKKSYKAKGNKKFKHIHEITGIFLFALGLLTFFSIYFQGSIGVFGEFTKNLLSGLLGLSAFLVPFLIAFYSWNLIFNKNDFNIKAKTLFLVFLIIFLSALFETLKYNISEFENLSVLNLFKKLYINGIQLDGGGVFGGIIAIPFLSIFKQLGTFVILVTFIVADLIMLTSISIKNVAVLLKNLIIKLYSTHNIKNKALTPKIEDSINLKKKIKKDIDDKKLNVEEPKEFKELNQIEVNISENKKIDIEEKLKEEVALNKTFSNYNFPSIDLLSFNSENYKNSKNLKNIAIKGAQKLEDTLRSFGVEASIINISRGPAVTRYELQPSSGVKVSKIVSLADDISLNLASSGIRIEAPIPGKAAIGIEVPNKEVTAVLLREVIESPEFSSHTSRVAFALGKDISGENIIADIAKMPHLLVAGATGSGKSVCINSIIISLLFRASPSEVKLLMIDPKVVELGIYNGIPHLLIPVVTDPKKAAGALNWAVQEMVTRYKNFAEKGVRDIKGYNELMKDEGELLPQVVIIIDELADLMMVAPNDVEDAVCRLAQMARAAGMHLVIATQRPSVDVITGVIKANIPSRISFAVSSQVDSRTILDMAGAEKLIGRGDMLYYPIGESKPIRVKGAFVTDKEVEKIVEYIKSQTDTSYDEEILNKINVGSDYKDNSAEDCDEFLAQAIEMVFDSGQASASLIQRKFKVGYARASRIIDQMEARGIVSGYEGSKPRQIIMTRQQWDEIKMSKAN